MIRPENKNIAITVGMLLFSFIICFLNFKTSPLYLINEWCDPNIYFSIGKGMFNGKVVYKDLFDHKGPLIFIIYGIGYLISNTSFTGVYLIQSLFLFTSLLFAYKLSKLYLNDIQSFIITLIYTCLFFSKTGTGGSADEFMLPFFTVSFYYFILYFKKENNLKQATVNKIMLIQGLTFGAVFFIKFSAAIFWIPILAAIYYTLFASKKYKEALSAILYTTLGFSILAAPLLLYFLINSAFGDFVFAYFKFNAIYANTGFTINTLKTIAGRFIGVGREFYIAWALTLGGLAVILFSNRFVQKKVYKAAILISFIITYLPIANSRFHHLYAYIVLYVLAIIALIYLFQLINSYIKSPVKIKPAILYITVPVITIVSITHYHTVLYNNKDCLSFSYCRDKCWMLQKDFAEVIKTRENPTLLDLGLDRGIFTTSGVVPTFKYFFHPLISDEDFPEILEYQTELVKNKEPMFIVTTDKNFPYLMENYDIAAIDTFHYLGNDLHTYLFERKE
ncbi:glycosyltransferase family 39 protein [Dysgonomonas sp. 511]|uniref:ArnT family glycosyltransferase n=1 Tax=Dysgonomonas sp. 511 TaxID=2302930 RepID=UPI0013D2E7D8|nr:glycosyltransferase family 39 protein [Dysgonomonas sp. 511]NDV78443.1 hypothetical protein [Dysgonomonas sp. 511]